MQNPENPNLEHIVPQAEREFAACRAHGLSPLRNALPGLPPLHCVLAVREAFKDPFYMSNLETVSKRYAGWLEQRSPGTYSTFAARVK